MAVIPIERYHEIWRKRSERIANIGDRTPVASAKFMAARTRSLVPYSRRGKGTGGLHMRDTIQQRNNVVSVSGVSPKGFPYIHWVNQTTQGYAALTMRRLMRTGRFTSRQTNKRFLTPNSPFTAIYGSTPSNWRWTGTAGFFRIATEDTRRYFGRVVVKNIRNTLRATA